jgi:hypothetical protein
LDYPVIRLSFAEGRLEQREQLDARIFDLLRINQQNLGNHLTTPDIARAMREGLRNLYSVIKGQDAHIKFAFSVGKR